MRRLRFALLVLGWIVTVLLLAACERDILPSLDTTGEGGSITTSTGEGGSGGDIFDTTSSSGGEGGGPVCAGVCKESEPTFFSRLSLWWIGPSKDAPPCPDVAPLEGSEGYADPIAPHTCPVCSCSPAGCALPEDMHVAAATCPGDGAPSLAWTSPGWEGVCTADGAIPQGFMCGGGPCAQSLTIGAATVEPCTPISSGAEDKPDPAWGQLARECLIGPLTGEGCETPGHACVPAPPESFRLCVHRPGDNPDVMCPESYPDRFVVYAGFADARGCEPCSCGEPQGAECSALVQVFADGACGVQLASATVAPDDPSCVDLPASGVGLGSKQADWKKQTPGTCAESGGPVGGIVLSEPQTLCCEAEPPPAE